MDNGLDSNLIVKGIYLEKNVVSYDRYPFNIDVVKDFDHLDFHSPVAFLLVKMELVNRHLSKQLLFH